MRPLFVPAIVTGKIPAGVVFPVAMVSETVTGFVDVGCTELEGANWQDVPAGNPLGQLRSTLPSNGPAAVTTNVIGLETFDRPTATLEGLGALIA